MTDPTRVLIVGAGPTGLALACELYSRGVPCRVVDAAESRSDRSKGIAFWPRTLEILRDLGVAAEAERRGIALAHATLWSGGRQVLDFDLTALRSRYRHGLVLPQHQTEALLEQRLAQWGGGIERGVRCTDVDHRPGRPVRVKLAGGAGTEIVEVEWLVGCDGPASTVRAGAGIATHGGTERYGWILADAEVDTALTPDGVNYFLHDGGVLHTVPIPGGRWRLTMTAGPDRPDPADWPLSRIQAAVSRAPVPMRVRGLDWVSGFRVRQGIADRFRQGRVLLAGDAAHVHSPAGAQGINAGLQDAANLGWKLALVSTAQAPPSLLDSYDAERRPAAATTVRMSDRASRMATLRQRPARASRDRLWRLAGRSGVVSKVVAPAIAGVSQSYPAGISAASGWGLLTRRARLAAGSARGRTGVGSRLPDLELVPHSDWLWDQLPTDTSVVLAWPGSGRPWDDVDGFTALWRAVPDGTPVIVVDSPGLPGGRLPADPLWRQLPDPAGELSELLGAGADLALVVRPDRYVGARCPASAPGPVRTYFRALGKAR